MGESPRTTNLTDEIPALVKLIHEARQCSSRLEGACHEAEIDLRTYRR